MDVDFAALVAEALLDDAQVEAEDFARGRFVEGRVVEGDVDAGGEGLVKVADAVGREEEDACVVFEDAEEDLS